MDLQVDLQVSMKINFPEASRWASRLPLVELCAILSWCVASDAGTARLRAIEGVSGRLKGRL